MVNLHRGFGGQNLGLNPGKFKNAELQFKVGATTKSSAPIFHGFAHHGLYTTNTNAHPVNTVLHSL